jgi:FAD:protein FMN transferase
MTEVLLARNAMRVRFELVLIGESEAHLRAAGEEALDEISQVEHLLSPFEPSSDLFRVNALGFSQPVIISNLTELFLARAQKLTEKTLGAFDLTATSGGGGFALKDNSVTLPSPTTRLDPGGLAKGWALERASEILREAGITRALLHGGTSSVVGLGLEPWQIAVEDQVLTLQNDALSVSGTRERRHIFDPRTGQPVETEKIAVVVADSATDAEALSTALLVLGDSKLLRDRFPEIRVIMTL